jgi:lysophospholipase L1-like esterase
MTLRYVSGAELPVAGWWMYDGPDLIAGLSSGHTFELKIFPIGGASVLIKTTGITGQTGSGTGKVAEDTPNVVIAWADGDLDLEAGPYRIQMRVIRTSDGFDWIDQDDLIILPSSTVVAPATPDEFGELVLGFDAAAVFDDDDLVAAVVDGVSASVTRPVFLADTTAAIDALEAVDVTLDGRLDTLEVAGAVTATKTTTYIAVAGETVRCDATTAAFTVTLPTAAAANAVVTVKRVDSTTNLVTVAPAGADTIDGATSFVLVGRGSAVTFRKDSTTGWVVVENHAPTIGPGNVSYDRHSQLFLPSDSCLLNMKKAFARARNGGAAVRYICRGDSTTIGVISGTNPLGLTDMRDISWVDKARRMLDTSDALAAPVTESVMADTIPARSTFGSGWSAGGFVAVSSGAGAETFTWNDDYQANAYDIVILRSGNAPSITCNIDGAGAATLTLSQSNNTAAIFRVTHADVAAHDLVFTKPSSGTVTIYAIEPLNTLDPPVLKMARMGVSGQTLATLNPTVITSGSNMYQLLQCVPDTIQLLMGVNDFRVASPNLTTYKSNLQAFVTAFRNISCDPILTVFPTYNNAVSGPGVFEGVLWHQAIYEVAEEMNVAVLDLQRRWGYGTGPTTGGAGALYDGLHPTLAGYYDIARMVANFIANV